jgi:hypothetical protein
MIGNADGGRNLPLKERNDFTPVPGFARHEEANWAPKLI